MFLKKLTLTNVKCFKNLELDFTDSEGHLKHSNILLGNNGTGKSTILKSIALLLAGSSALGELLGKPSSWVTKGCKSCEIKGVLITKNKDIRNISISFAPNDSLFKILDKNQSSLVELDEALEYTDRNYLITGYGVSRNAMREGFHKRSSGFTSQRAENVATLFDNQASLYPIESWAIDLDYTGNEKQLAVIKTVLSNFLPDAEFLHIDKKKKELIFKVHGKEVELDELSDGYQVTTNWVGDLLYRISSIFQDHKNPLDARFLLLIDEIGLHLHPEWQRQILMFITKTFKNCQIIASTHSPFVAQQAGKGELISLENNNGDINARIFEGEPHKLLLSQIITSKIFNVSTDESVEIEETKKAYDKLKNKKSRNKADNDKLKQLKQSLTDAPLGSDLLKPKSDEYMSLMRELNQSIEKLKDDKA